MGQRLGFHHRRERRTARCDQEEWCLCRRVERREPMGARTMGGGRFDVGKSAEAAMAASASLGAFGRKAAFQMPTRSNGSSGDELR